MATRKRQSVHPRISSDSEPWEDEVLREAYATRDEYAEEHGYDLDRIYADLKQREAIAAAPARSALCRRSEIGRTPLVVSEQFVGLKLR